MASPWQGIPKPSTRIGVFHRSRRLLKPNERAVIGDGPHFLGNIDMSKDGTE